MKRFLVRADNPVPAGLDMIQRQAHGNVSWMRITGPTMGNLFVCIVGVLALEYRYRLLIGATRQGTRMVLNDHEERLLVAEMISIGTSRHVHMWWSINAPSQDMDLLFCGHGTCREDGTPPPGAINFGPHDNRANIPTCPFIVMNRTQKATSPSRPLQPKGESAG